MSYIMISSSSSSASSANRANFESASFESIEEEVEPKEEEDDSIRRVANLINRIDEESDSECSFDDDDDDDDDDFSNAKSSSKKKSHANRSIDEYETACYYLKIVPCKIVFKSLPTSSIILSNYGLTSTAVLALTQALKKNATVTKLDLSGNDIGSNGLKHLSNLFTENFTINELLLSRNFIGICGIDYLLEIFKKNNSVRKLDVSANDLSDDDGVKLIEAIDDNALTDLNLSQNKFAEKSGIVIGKWLADNNSLLDLNLSWNHFRKKGAIAIAKGIWDNNKLVRVNLSWNGFGNEGADIMGKALTHNVVLEELDLRSNRIGPQGFLNVCIALKDNASLKKLKIGNNNINNEVVEAIFKLLGKINPLNLQLLDISNVTFKPSIEESLKVLKSIHPHFLCIHGFLNSEHAKALDMQQHKQQQQQQQQNKSSDEDLIPRIKEYFRTNRASLNDLFPADSFQNNGPFLISSDMFKDILKTKTNLNFTSAQLDGLIKHLDRSGDDRIDLNEFIINHEQDQKLN